MPIGVMLGQMALFTEDTDFQVYMDASNPTPTQHIQGRTALAPVFDELNVYEATMHFNGQSTAVLPGSPRQGRGFRAQSMIAAIRYLDTFVKHDGIWYFNQRKLMVDWTETRAINTG